MALKKKNLQISEGKLIIERKTSFQMSQCKIVLEKGKEVVIVVSGKPCTMEFMRSRKAIEILGK